MPTKEISIIDVGHGNSTIIHANNETIIVDCGSHGGGLLQYLQDRNITEIKTVYLSHADQDHIGGLMTLLASKSITVKEVFLNSDSSKSTKLWDDLITILDDKSRQQRITFEVTIHDELPQQTIGEIKVTPVGPTKYLVSKGVSSADRQGRKITSNSISASFVITFNDHPVVFLSGDIDQISLDEIKFTNKRIQADVMVFPHHGGKIEEGDVVGFTKQLLTECKPSTVVFSLSRRKFKNPQPDVIAAVKATNAEIRIACTQLSQRCSAVLPKENPAHLHDYYAKGKHLKECCAGTFVINLDSGINIHPLTAAHQAFIAASAATAICQ
ncbi:MAG: MBL fold metallo-hydrolase [Bacteroidetes bacterium]|nr:MBL fold metallo-hydrolase [Bacteroidota bacterium]